MNISTAPAPIKSTLDDMAATLCSGGRIFVVGRMPTDEAPLHEFTEFVTGQKRTVQHVLMAVPPSESVFQKECIGVTVVESRRTSSERVQTKTGK